MVRIGIDAGSTTVKLVAVSEDGSILFRKYLRHGARIRETLTESLSELESALGDVEASVCLTGSVGMGVAERCGFPFVQEVVAAAKIIRRSYPGVATMIDIGGEDAKVVFFDSDTATDLRMNGNCAGGTGAFIDQMAIILGVGVDELGELAMKSTRLYPVASRCGVFCKTDIQNLVARNVPREDIAASIFHAVTIQTVVTLAHGRDIGTPVLFCGGPLTYIPALRKSFSDYLALREEDIVVPEDGSTITACGAAISAPVPISRRVSDIRLAIETGFSSPQGQAPSIDSLRTALPAIFSSPEEYEGWKRRISRGTIARGSLRRGAQKAYIGIDSGSTTVKIVALDEQGRMLFSWYRPNGGNPAGAVKEGLLALSEECARAGTVLEVAGSCSTGYGEDLVRTAFHLDGGIVETMAHYGAAHNLDPEVSFILDIGGQDMKAIFVNDGVIERIEINEACSSGCGSFMETFAKSLGYSASDFAQAACRSRRPSDLGTRCTVFMNSKVKQVLREGASIEDIAAGLCYSVIKNCLYKVLKLNNTAVLGKHIVVQGGTMRNDAIVRALEHLTLCRVSRCDVPELMGAIGCALHAMEQVATGAVRHDAPVSLEDMMAGAGYTTSASVCKGCENRCQVVRYRFGNGQTYYSGNRCERIFSNSGQKKEPAANVYPQKLSLLFDRAASSDRAASGGKASEKKAFGDVGVGVPPSGNANCMRVGLPRCLNMYEEFPFWHALLSACGLEPVLSDASSYKEYETVACKVMSDNICFPAKIAHAHIRNLQEKGVDRILMPFVIYEKPGREQNSYNCPIVAGYSEVVKSVQSGAVPIDSPVISFKDREMMHRQCIAYLADLGVSRKTALRALEVAEKAQEDFERDIVSANERIFSDSSRGSRLTIMLIGRPYHSDPLIQHKVADIIASMGVDVISDDMVRDKDIPLDDVHFVSQWAYTNRVLKAAKWAAIQGDNVQCVQLTSFGCGPDAFLTDAVRDMLMMHRKSLTLLKLDDIDNAGSMKLRIRSLVESLRASTGRRRERKAFRTVPVFNSEDRQRTILVPFFTPFVSPLIPAVMSLAGYKVENLPMSDRLSCELGLKYANNEVCYPCTLVVGDIIKGLESGRYDRSSVAVAMTQTGGQCRASNYISLIKKALVDAGYGDVPVISVSFNSGISNYQPGFKINWGKMLVPALYTVLYSDCIAKLYYPAVVRESSAGAAAALKDAYLKKGADVLYAGKDIAGSMLGLLRQAARDFDAISLDRETAKVGVVGEIYLKFNPFAHKDVTGWLIGKGVEIAPPILLDFFIQYFVNRRTKKTLGLEKSHIPDFLYDGAYSLIMDKVRQADKICSAYRYYTPFNDVFEEAKYGRELVSLHNFFGEGWLLPAEIASYCRHGVNNVISLQPFGCIANHIVEKGIENKIKKIYPDINLLSLDFDSGVSDVNITNRMLLFLDNIRMPQEAL